MNTNEYRDFTQAKSPGHKYPNLPRLTWYQNQQPTYKRFKVRIHRVEDDKSEYVEKPRWQKCYSDGGNVIWNNLKNNQPVMPGEIIWVNESLVMNLYIMGQRHQGNPTHPDIMYEPIYYAAEKSFGTSDFQG